MNNIGGGGAGCVPGPSHQQYCSDGRYVGRGGQPHTVKVRRKCVQVACQPSLLFLACTICMTALASVLLSVSITGTYWEMLTYDTDKVHELVARNKSLVSVQWLFEGKVALISYDSVGSSPAVRYLVPLHSGVWISCIDLEEVDFGDLVELGYKRENKCIDHLDPDSPKPIDAKASWQHRMQNLAIACALVCLILLGAAILVGLFGVLRPQISAVLVTGVIYVLAATFALFTLTIVHFKHKNRKDCDPLDVWTRLIPELADNSDFRTARVISHGWSLQLAWAGTCICILASIMWILLSKMMRYNPITLNP